LTRIVADRGYRGHNAPPDMRFKIYISGQRRGVTDAIKRELRGRSAVEPAIGHAKAEHRTGRNFLKGVVAPMATISTHDAISSSSRADVFRDPYPDQVRRPKP
jgi:hypothetical protein